MTTDTPAPPRRVPVLTMTLASAGLVVGLLSASVALLGSAPAGAATQTVTTCADSGAGSLRQAVSDAASGDTVNFSPSLGCGPIALQSPLDITTSLAIDGGAPNAIEVSQENSCSCDEVFDIASGVTATLSGLTIDLGSSDGTDGLLGGGIDNNGNLTLTDSTVTNNSGGGIGNFGSLTITDSTISDNSTGIVGGGGIVNEKGSTLTISDSTLADNLAGGGNSGGAIENSGTLSIDNSTLVDNQTAVNGDGGGIDAFRGTVTITNSTFADNIGGNIVNSGGTVSAAATLVTNNISGGDGDDCSGKITNLGDNLANSTDCGFTTSPGHKGVGLDPAGLQDNGGPTETIALEPDSPAVGAVTEGSLCSAPDQRGVARPTPCDVGAVQLEVSGQAITSADSDTVAANAPFSFTVTTSGSPVPHLSKSGRLPKHVTFVDNHDGTATLAGTPTKAGVFHLTLKARYGTHVLVSQAFTLTVS